MSTDAETYLERKYLTNGYHSSSKSRSCENHLDTCGEKLAEEDLATSSSSLIDLPTSHADYDNLPLDNHPEENSSSPSSPSPSPSSPSPSPSSPSSTNKFVSPISSELDQKTKEAIDARLKEIDDEFDSTRKQGIFDLDIAFFYPEDLLGPVRSETVNKSVDLPSARRLAKRLYMLDGFKSTDVIRHLCKR